MIQDIINGIITAIRTEYDKTFRIYTESTEQGLIEPCFSILCLTGTDTQNVGDRHNRAYPFNISYFPSSDEPYAECLNVMETLYDLLSIIGVSSEKIRGTDMSGEVVDGVLHFRVTYACFLLMVKAAETGMEGLEVNTDGKE